MANYIQNDRGEFVIAEGETGSAARCFVQYPALIERLRTLPTSSQLHAIREAGVLSSVEIVHILLLANGVPTDVIGAEHKLASIRDSLMEMAVTKIEELKQERDHFKQQAEILAAGLKEAQEELAEHV